MANAPDDLDEVYDDFKRGIKEITSNAKMYQVRQDFLDNEVKEVISHPDLAKLLSKYGDNFKLNYAAIPVFTLSDRVDLLGLTCEEKEIQDKINDLLWEPNDLGDDADDFHTKAMGLGDYYAVAWPKPVDDSTDLGTIEVFGKHPTNARILYDLENQREPWFGVYRWQVKKDRWRACIVYDDVTYNLEARKSDGTKGDSYQFLIDSEDEDGKTVDAIDNPWGVFPMFHFRADGKPYGKPVNRGAYGPQEAITKITVTEMAGMDYIGFPQRYALLDPTAEIDDDIADDFNDEGTTDHLDDETDPSRVISKTQSKIKNTPGSAWLLAGVKEAGEFEAGDPDKFTKARDSFVAAAATLTGISPRHFGVASDGNDPSGESRRREDAPMVKHAGKLMGTFGQTWVAISKFALEVWSRPKAKVTPNWAPAEVSTDKEGLEIVALKIENGVPPRDALLQAGYTIDQVDEWLPEKDPNSLITLGSAGKLAEALKNMGNAVTLDTMSAEDVRNLFSKYLTGPAPEPKPDPVVMPPGLLPPGEVDPITGEPVKPAPPKGVTPPQLAKTALPAK